MADIKIKVTLKGDKIVSGSMDLRRLASFSQDFQELIDKLAVSLERDKGNTLDQQQVRLDTALSLTGIHDGSTELMLVATDSTPLSPYEYLLGETIESFVEGISILQENPSDLPTIKSLPTGWDQAVLNLAHKMGSPIPNEITEMQFEIITEHDSLQAIYDQPLRARIKQLIAEPEERIESIIGRLLQVNFKATKEDRFSCRVYLDDEVNRSILCRFEEEIAEKIETAVRKTVGIIGIATIDSVTEEFTEFRIKDLISYIGDKKFGEFEDDVLEMLRNYRRDNDSAASFARGWSEVLEGKLYDISTLWDDFDDE